MTNLTFILCVTICVLSLAFLYVIYFFTKRINKNTEELYEAQNKNREMKEKNNKAFALMYSGLSEENCAEIDILAFDNLNQDTPKKELWLIIKDGLYEAKDIKV